MKQLSIGVLVCLTTLANAQSENNILKHCWEKQVKPLHDNYLTFTFSEKRNELEHSFKPWQESTYSTTGIVWCNADSFLKSDTLTFRGNKYNAQTQLTGSTLLFLDYGHDKLLEVTQGMYQNQLFKTIRYAPMHLIDYFFQQKIPASDVGITDFAIYETSINKALVKLYIRKSDNLLDKISILSYDELFGDVLSTFSYKDYSNVNELAYPKTIQIEKINGKIKDEIVLSTEASIVKEAPRLLEQPLEYTLKEDIEITTEVQVEHHSNYLHFIELKHTNDRVLLVEFADFILLAEAPLNSKNGELIIREAKKIAPNKPIKYFVFGHFHPHYLGGMRPFIHKEATILCSAPNKEYVTYLANAPHTLSPDSLQLEPKPLRMEVVKDSLTISDGQYKMQVYFIGERSVHTNDYLIYYFPSEKLLFQDDLVWIAKEGEIKKASGRQAGLYNAVVELGLDVNTIVQSWPVGDNRVKTLIPFADLEKSMQVE